jgi:hypothetical protein
VLRRPASFSFLPLPPPPHISSHYCSTTADLNMRRVPRNFFAEASFFKKHRIKISLSVVQFLKNKLIGCSEWRPMKDQFLSLS